MGSSIPASRIVCDAKLRDTIAKSQDRGRGRGLQIHVIDFEAARRQIMKPLACPQITSAHINSIVSHSSCINSRPQISAAAIAAGATPNIGAVKRHIDARAIQAGAQLMADVVSIDAEKILRHLRSQPAAESAIHIIDFKPNALPDPKPATPAEKADPVRELIETAAAITYTEVYGVFRKRKHVIGDRLVDCLHTADTLDEAVVKLIRMAGFDQKEAEELGLNKFDSSDLDALYRRLEKLTGDTYEISSYEQPALPQEDEE